MLYGVDVYYGDGIIDWSALYGKGVRWAAIKVSQGTNIVDKKAKENVQNARAAGLYVMPYHYLWPVKGSAQGQFEKFVEGINEVGGYDGLLVPALDVEGDQNNSIRDLSSDEYVQLAKDWLTLLEKVLGCKGVVYTYQYFASSIIQGRLKEYPLWASSFTDKGPGYPASFVGWGSKWLFHQYTYSNKPNPLGISIADQDLFNGEVADMEKLVLRRNEIVSVINHSTGAVIARYQVVPDGNHIADQKKLYVKV